MINMYILLHSSSKSLPVQVKPTVAYLEIAYESVVPQAAEFTYILFTQEISTRVTSCQHGLSDLNKRHFQLDIS